MQHNAPDFRHRSQLDELMEAPCSREQMRACLRDLAWTNRWTLAYRPQMHWLDSLVDKLSALSEPIRILDVACGYGDGLRRIEQWAHKRGIAVELIGLELNPDATVIAAEATPASSRIRWVTADVFAYEPQHPVHLVIS
jgi:SAM-dependent methyltransferase